MMKFSPPSPLRASDYEAIETALLESTRGRWFLNEFSRRNRTADTQMLLDAITKLEASFMMPGRVRGEDLIRHELVEMSEAISRTRAEIAAITSSDEDNKLVDATEELDAIVDATEKATSDILEAAEDVQETAWLLREQGVDDRACDRLDQRATDIYTACSFQDITGQRTGKVVAVLRYLEQRVNGLVDAWGLEGIEIRYNPQPEDRSDSNLLNGPQLAGKGLEQAAVDDVIRVADGDIEFVDEPVAAADAAGAPSAQTAASAPRAETPPEPSPDATTAPAQPSPRAEAAEPSSGTGATKADVPAAATAPAVAEPGVVSAQDFGAPGGDLELGSLGPVKTAALFS